ncbi:hypothetical protein AVEN_180976-1 [Araneus ventricosus]|uniref:Integrase catalytic domain-containing protein n=1 Tax=Araneus ventricosus TaxID=182803 RepID=A0A4Y2SF41_ARAVE|nr:hypothetical protein AVEN_180976-1 [Araneus ventricosus]
MKNAASGRTKTHLPALYDELEAKIRALESLGRTQEKYDDFLSPLVESCLPEEILVAWERSRNIKDASQVEDRSLEKLMHFLKQEVKGEEMVELARTGFLSPANQKKKEMINKLDNCPTAATLVSTNIRNNTVAWVLRFINNVKSRINERKRGQLTVEEIQGAEIQLIRSIQALGFPEEKLIPNLCVFKDEKNIIRVKTRITERIDTPHFLSPILLPNNCIVTQRLVEHIHIENYHAGTQLFLSMLREKYWIFGGKRTVPKIWNACVMSRRFKSKSPTADPVSLPADRVKDAAVFEVVGVDLAGPLYIKRGTKVWAVLYTCALYRSLHLELVSSLSTYAFLLSFRHFVARRGRPRIIYSYNGTHFRGVYNELAAIDWNEVSRNAEIQRITWKFVPPAWWGGFWDRLVRTVKDLLRKTLGKAIFTYEELLTILCECEKVVNSRPLTYLSEDMQDLTPITPAIFLFDILTAEVKDLDVRDANHYRKRLRFRAKVIEKLRKRFRSEYLGQPIQRQKQDPQSSNIRE